MEDNKSWYRLDNAGKMYSSLVSSRSTTLFRVSVTLKKKIEPELLQLALEKALVRYPFLKAQLKQGVFWYYLEGTSQMPQVEEEIYYPCMSLPIKTRGTFPYRVLYFNKRIALEISHSMSDGTGGLTFLREILGHYLDLKEGVPYESEVPTDQQLQEETENAFLTYYEKKIPVLKSRTMGKSYKLPLELDEKGHYYITTGIMSVTELKKVSKQYGTSITILLTAIYIESLLHIQSQTARKRSPVVINVPVNMRSFFKSETMRNFFVSIAPSIDGRLGDYTFEEIVNELKTEFSRLLTEKKLKQYINRSVIGEKSIGLRVMPTPIKNILTPTIYSFFGESQYTSGLSNIGLVQVPSEIEDYIERFECYPPPSIGNKVKAVMMSFKDNVYLSFGNLSKNRMLEREFFRRAIRHGINVTIETNEEVK